MKSTLNIASKANYEKCFYKYACKYNEWIVYLSHYRFYKVLTVNFKSER